MKVLYGINAIVKWSLMQLSGKSKHQDLNLHECV